jgi:NAD(P)H-quinone oxidoreductase subunit L
MSILETFLYLKTIMLLTETNLVALLYLVLSGTYLVVLPALVYLYLKNRWYSAGSIERLIMYLFVFLSFPGMLLLSPFLNFRPKRRTLKA